LQNIQIPKFGPGIRINGVDVNSISDLLPLFRDDYLAGDEPPEFSLVFGATPIN
jgi:hypothetical protein